MTKQKLMEEINALSVSDLDQLRFRLMVWNEWKMEKLYECHDIDTVAGLLFDLSLSHDIIGIQAYGFPKDRYVYLSLKECVGHSSNIDKEMMDAISRIEFWKEG